jgi:hypothetical protein
VTVRTKQLEMETIKWQQRWEESNTALNKMRENYTRVQDDLVKSKDSLEKMKGLCRTLHNENRDLQSELNGQKNGGEVESNNCGLTENAAETLATINLEEVEAKKAAQEKSQTSPVKEESTPIVEATPPKSPSSTPAPVNDANGNATMTESISTVTPTTPINKSSENLAAPQSPTSPGSSSPSTPTPGGGGDGAKGKKNKKKKSKK